MHLPPRIQHYIRELNDPVARIEKVGRQVSRQARGVQHALEKLEDIEEEKRHK